MKTRNSIKPIAAAAVLLSNLFVAFARPCVVELKPVQREIGHGLGKSSIGPDGAIENLYNRPFHTIDDPTVEPLPVELTLQNPDGEAKKIKVELRATDAYGKPIKWSDELIVEFTTGEKSRSEIIYFKGGTGAFTIYADVSELNSKALSKSVSVQQNAAITTVVAAPVRPGIKRYSFYSVNSHTCKGNWSFIAGTGMKIIRWDISANLAELEPHGLWALPCCGVGSSVTGGGEAYWTNLRSNVAKWKDKLSYIEFLNEPWIYGGWNQAASTYRDAHRRWLDVVKEATKGATQEILTMQASSWYLFIDVTEGWPEKYAGMSGPSDHPYDPTCNLATSRPGSLTANADLGRIICRRTGMPYAFVTEGGQWVGKVGPVETAYKLVQIYFLEALAGMYLGCSECGWLGIGPGNDLTNSAFAVLAWMTEDRVIVADIWPYNNLLNGAIYANKKLIEEEPVIKTWPRVADISARWKVAVSDDRINDNEKVAIFFSNTGLDNDNWDKNGKLTISIEAGDDLKAYDVQGRPINPSGSELTVDFGPSPVYITTTKLSVQQLRERIRSAKITGITPVNAYALSMGKPADQVQDVIVRVQNQMPEAISGTLTIEPINGNGPASVPISIEEGRLLQVPVKWTGVTVNSNNVYGVKITVDAKTARGMSLPRYTREHFINSAICYANKKITIDGNLNDWTGVLPMTLDANLTMPATVNSVTGALGTVGNGTIVAKVYLAYDENYVYVAADVKEPGWVAGAGTPQHGYPGGLPGGLFTPSRFGDIFMFSFGMRNRASQAYGRSVAEPWCWKGHIYDTDYLYLAHGSTQGDMLVQAWDDRSMRRWGYQTDALDHHKRVPNGKIKISRGSTTVYECAIPRSEIPLFDPSKFDMMRFCYVISNNEKVAMTAMNNKDDADNQLQYARMYGVFDHWYKYGCSSFGPSWTPFRSAQTYCTVEGGKAADVNDTLYGMLPQTPLVTANTSVAAFGVTQYEASPTISLPRSGEIDRIYGRKKK